MSSLFGVPLLLGFVAFLVGWLAAKFAAYVGARAVGLEAPEQHHTIRALEASLRVAQKEVEATDDKLSTSMDELDTLRISFDEMEQTLEFRDTELDTMRQAVKQESKKVVELRRELTDHAEETIRANVMARDSETELSVLKAGATAVFDEVTRLESERDELTNRLKALDEDVFDKPMIDEPGIDQPGVDKSGADQPGADQPGAVESEADESGQRGRQADEYMPDC